jgi:hypothetical protein
MRDSSSRQHAIREPSPAATPSQGDRLFQASAAAALCLHAALLLRPGLEGGADLLPHLRLMEQMAAAPGLRSVYPPAYHALGALLLGWLGAEAAVKLLAFAGVAALIAGFRAFQRAAGLPPECAAVFALAPYGFALSWCLPKVEAAGYGLACFGLACVWRERPRALAACLAGAFAVHTGAALFLGLTAGVAALARRDRRALAGLLVGCLLAAPLFAAHLAAGCSAAEALLLSRGDYLRSIAGWSSLSDWPRVVALAGPPAVAAAALGAAPLWREHRAAAVVALAVLAVYANELWLAPLGARTTLNLLRGLTVLAIPVAAAAGVAAAARPRLALPLLVACAAWALGAAWLVLPGSCHRAPIELSQLEATHVDRCRFQWAVRIPR